MEEAGNSKVGRDMGGLIEVAGDGCVTAVHGGITKVFSESVTKAAFGFTDVDFVAFGACHSIKYVS